MNDAPGRSPASAQREGLAASLMQRAQTLRQDLDVAGRYMAQTFRLMVGVPDYDSYVRHLREQHPEREPPSYEVFFLERQKARYEGGSGRCC